jgi:hypothetical protein
MMIPVALAMTTSLLCLAIGGSALAATPPCPELQTAKPQDRLAYLRGDRAMLMPPCIVFAITQLGIERYAVATDTLAEYLDFRMPGTEEHEHGVAAINRIPWIGDKYPAAAALFEIGKPASPSLVRVVGNAASSELMRTNALEILLFIHREDMAEAVALLNKASRFSRDPATSIRLWDSARKEAAQCPRALPELRIRCEAALFDENRD